VTKILPLLASPNSKDAPSFHVVAPSLPNFGFSSAPSKVGFGIAQYAECLHKLMLKLGYDKYGMCDLYPHVQFLSRYPR
jgi:pimeloyl-ACP methyl ester carboxylesterase